MKPKPSQEKRPGFNRLPGLKLLADLRRPLYKNSLFLVADTVTTAGLGFFFWMVVARFYAPADVGYGSAAISAITLLATISLAGLNTALIRFLPRAEKPVPIINFCLLLSALFAFGAAAVFIAGLNLWSPALSFIGREPVFAAAFVVYCIAFAVSSVLDAVFIARRRAQLVLAMDAVASVLKLVLPVVMVANFHSFGIASSAGLATAVAVMVGLFFLTRLEKGYRPWAGLNLGRSAAFRRYSFGSYLASLLASAPGWVLPIMVVNLIGARENAYFYIVWSFYGILLAFAAAVANSLFAEGSHETGLGRHLGDSLKLIILLLGPAAVVLLLLGGPILGLFGREYADNGLPLLRVLAVTGLVSGVNVIYYAVLRVEKKLKELCLLAGLQALAGLLAAYFLGARLGITGIGYAWLGSQAAVSLYAAFALGCILKKEAPQSV